MHEQLSKILAPYRGQKGASIAVLQKVQEELGYLPEEAISEIANFLGLSKSEVYGVASFYALFRFERQGEHTIRVCQGTACHVRGAPRLLDKVIEALNIRPGQTSRDMRFSLNTVNCLGCCALGPVMVVDEEYHSNPSSEKIEQIFAACN